MSNTKLVPTWTFQRSLPEPFDVYSGSSAVFKNISSRYCTQPQKKATLHAATLQAVFTYMDLENPPAGKTPEELGAIGSQSNNFTIAEYPSLPIYGNRELRFCSVLCSHANIPW